MVPSSVGLKDILIAGGPTLLLLIGLSIYSVALAWERWRFHGRAAADSKHLLDRLRAMIRDGNLGDALNVCRNQKSLAAAAVAASLVGPVNREDRRRSTDRAIERGAVELMRGVPTLGTIGSVAPFIGLFGTVLGVMRAFKDLASAAGAGPGVVAIGISEALVCTAAGLVVAIPAVAAYNYFTHRVDRFSQELTWITEEIIESLTEKAHK